MRIFAVLSIVWCCDTSIRPECQHTALGELEHAHRAAHEDHLPVVLVEEHHALVVRQAMCKQEVGLDNTMNKQKREGTVTREMGSCTSFDDPDGERGRGCPSNPKDSQLIGSEAPISHSDPVHQEFLG